MTNATARNEILYVGIELSKNSWRLAFSNGAKIRQRTLPAGNQAGLQRELAWSKQKLGLSADCAVRSCYETGRDGFWVHRLLSSWGIENVVVDAASIETARRARRAKTDRLDAEKLVRKLMAWAGGERTVWRLAQVPSLAAEAERRPMRERQRLTQERTAHRARIASLVALHGVAVKLNGRQEFAVAVEQLRDWQGQPLPAAVAAELQRELRRLALVHQQILLLEKRQERALRSPQTAAEQVAQKLMRLSGVGPISAMLFAVEFFGWRRFRNRRQVGALAGLCGTPYASGDSAREQGISKAGNKRVRWAAVELAWCWLRFQPHSALTKWFWQRFGLGSKRVRRIGIVALARKLLVALWKYLEWGELPAGAALRAAG
jgi:transposase